MTTAPPTNLTIGPSTEDHPSHESPRSKRGLEPANMALNLTSMIDVIFQLLIYFVITASFTVGEGIITAKLPAGTGNSSEQVKPPERPINIILSSAGAYGVRVNVAEYPQAPADFNGLAEMLRRLQHNPEKGLNGPYPDDNPVLIKPDGAVRWQHVVNAFNAAVAARYKNVSFAQATEAAE
jgi:biopolymer transport protein ExbD